MSVSVEYYNIRDKKILIYGAGSQGLYCREILQKNGLVLHAFIDKRHRTLKECEGSRVYGIPDLADFENKDDYCIIIAIRNVFDHSSLAMEFYRIGFRAVIFKPVTVLRKNATEVTENISQAHDALMVCFTVPDFPVCFYEKERIVEWKDHARITYDGSDGFCKCYIPSQLLFSNVIPRYLWSERNFVSNYVGVELYRAFGGDGILEAVIEKYVERFALPGALEMKVDVSGEWKNILIDSRLAVYNEMCYKQAVMPEFFVDNCTTVSLREGGGFRLTASGKNRVSFLIARGMRFIPVKISRKDYETFVNVEEVQKLQQFLDERDITELDVPVPHPYFYQFRYRIPQYMEEWESRVGFFLCELAYQLTGKYEFMQIRIADYSNDNGSISRFLKMIGFRVERRIHSELSGRLDKLLKMPVDDGLQGCAEVRIFTDLTGDLPKEAGLEDISEGRICFVLESDDKSAKITDEVQKYYPYGKQIMHALWKGKFMTGSVYAKEEKYVIWQ